MEWFIIPWGTLGDMQPLQNCDIHRLRLLAATTLIETLKVSETSARSLEFQLKVPIRFFDNLHATKVELGITPKGRITSRGEYHTPCNTFLHRLLHSPETLSVVPRLLDYDQLCGWADSC
jgi:hypothetical protein